MGLLGEGKIGVPADQFPTPTVARLARQQDDGSPWGMKSVQSDPPPATGLWVAVVRMVFWGPGWFALRGVSQPGQVFSVFWDRCPVFARMCPVFGQMCPLFGPDRPKCVHLARECVNPDWTWGRGEGRGESSEMRRGRVTRIGAVWRRLGWLGEPAPGMVGAVAGAAGEELATSSLRRVSGVRSVEAWRVFIDRGSFRYTETMRRPSIRSKWRRLLVSRVRSWRIAVAPISRSKSPMRLPAERKRPRSVANTRQISSSIEITSTPTSKSRSADSLPCGSDE